MRAAKVFTGQALFNKNMRDDIKTPDAHRSWRQGKAASLGWDVLLKDVLPPSRM